MITESVGLLESLESSALELIESLERVELLQNE